MESALVVVRNWLSLQDGSGFVCLSQSSQLHATFLRQDVVLAFMHPSAARLIQLA